jgi:hypothetical protein
MTGFGAELPVLQAPRSGKCCPFRSFVDAAKIRRETKESGLSVPVGTSLPASENLHNSGPGLGLPQTAVV